MVQHGSGPYAGPRQLAQPDRGLLLDRSAQAAHPERLREFGQSEAERDGLPGPLPTGRQTPSGPSRDVICAYSLPSSRSDALQPAGCGAVIRHRNCESGYLAVGGQNVLNNESVAVIDKPAINEKAPQTPICWHVGQSAGDDRRSRSSFNPDRILDGGTIHRGRP